MFFILLLFLNWKIERKKELNLVWLCVLCWFSSSTACQETHWNSGHKAKCKNYSTVSGLNSAQNGATNRGFKASSAGGKSSNSIALVPSCGTSRPIKPLKDVIFFYHCFYKFLICFDYYVLSKVKGMAEVLGGFNVLRIDAKRHTLNWRIVHLSVLCS